MGSNSVDRHDHVFLFNSCGTKAHHRDYVFSKPIVLWGS